MPKGKSVWKLNSCPRGEASRTTVKFSISNWKRVYLFYFSRPTLLDRSCIFCEISLVSRYGIVNHPFIYTSLASAKFFVWFSLVNYKFSLDVCLFLGFSSDDRYQMGQWISSSNHRPNLYQVISFIQWGIIWLATTWFAWTTANRLVHKINPRKWIKGRLQVCSAICWWLLECFEYHLGLVTNRVLFFLRFGS